MKKADAIWLAGLLEGKGGWSMKGGKYKSTVPRFVFQHKDLAVVNEVARLVSEITGKRMNRPYWRVNTCGNSGHVVIYAGGTARKIAQTALPHMRGWSPKVARIREVCGL